MIGSRVAVAVVALALLPPQCAKLLGENKPPQPVAVDPPPPPPPPSITAPPVWHPPEPPDADAGTTKAETPSDAARARAAIDAKEYKRARAILEKKVKSGGASPEEVQLLVEACAPLKDKSCLSIAKKAGAAPASE